MMMMRMSLTCHVEIGRVGRGCYKKIAPVEIPAILLLDKLTG